MLSGFDDEGRKFDSVSEWVEVGPCDDWDSCEYEGQRWGKGNVEINGDVVTLATNEWDQAGEPGSITYTLTGSSSLKDVSLSECTFWKMELKIDRTDNN